MSHSQSCDLGSVSRASTNWGWSMQYMTRDGWICGFGRQTVCSWPLNNMGLSCTGPVFCGLGYCAIWGCWIGGCRTSAVEELCRWRSRCRVICRILTAPLSPMSFKGQLCSQLYEGGTSEIPLSYIGCKLSLLTVRKCINSPREVRISLWCWGNWSLGRMYVYLGDLWCWFSLLELSEFLLLPGLVGSPWSCMEPKGGRVFVNNMRLTFSVQWVNVEIKLQLVAAELDSDIYIKCKFPFHSVIVL